MVHQREKPKRQPGAWVAVLVSQSGGKMTGVQLVTCRAPSEPKLGLQQSDNFPWMSRSLRRWTPVPAGDCAPICTATVGDRSYHLTKPQPGSTVDRSDETPFSRSAFRSSR